ncbi:MAG: 4-(cytidine 5'-diphospho)-2-C-methyl-D-erythritol kinase [Planctomycetia bacterium]|nr:4-(cytidine 5'-diphospho)-2-C-methyl-D-erythritol kinase [Planctomycetia bacterium]
MAKVITAPAKINLFLEVLRRCADGYHEIESLATAISLSDRLLFEKREDEKVTLQVVFPTEEPLASLFPTAAIPDNETNLVMRAARLLQRQTSQKLCGVNIILQKRIPACSGLGGGSSDAAATLRVLNEFWELGLASSELASLGAELGCDVPLFLSDFPVICTGRGEVFQPVADSATLPPLFLVLIRPWQGLSTPEVYRNCLPRASVTKEADGSAASIPTLLEAWRKSRSEDFAANLWNRLKEPAQQLLPELRDVEKALAELEPPCVGVSMTGSGSTCFGVYWDENSAHTAARQLQKQALGMVWVVQSGTGFQECFSSPSCG